MAFKGKTFSLNQICTRGYSSLLDVSLLGPKRHPLQNLKALLQLPLGWYLRSLCFPLGQMVQNSNAQGLGRMGSKTVDSHITSPGNQNWLKTNLHKKSLDHYSLRKIYLTPLH